MKYSRFYLEKRKTGKDDKRKEWPVVVWFNYNGNSFHRTIGVKATEVNWDSKKQRLTAPKKIEIFRGSHIETKYIEKWEILTTHIGRKTFVTIAATKGIPINVVASITGQNPALR